MGSVSKHCFQTDMIPGVNKIGRNSEQNKPNGAGVSEPPPKKIFLQPKGQGGGGGATLEH